MSDWKTNRRRFLKRGIAIGAITPAVAVGSGTAEPGSDKTIAYNKLPPVARRMFSQAVKSGTITGKTGINSEKVEPLFDHDFVEKDGEKIPIDADRDETPRKILSTNKLHDRSPSSEHPRLEGIPANAKSAIQNTLQSPGTRQDYRIEEFPSAPILSTGTRFQYEGHVFEIAVGDAFLWEYSFSTEGEA